MACSKPWRRRRILAGLLLLLAVVADRWVQRNPEPYFEARHGTLTGVELQASVQLPGARLEELRLTSSSGLQVELSILRPEGGPHRGPAILILGGHRTGRDAVRLVPPQAGLLVAAISYPYDGSTRLRGGEVVRALPEIRRALLDTPPALSLAVDHLLADPSVDPRRVELAGVSLGGPLACIAGAVDPRISRVWSIHGGGALGTMLERNLARQVPSPWLRKPLAKLGAWLLSPLQPERYVARISPRPLVLINARDDRRIPRESVDSLYAAAGEPKEMIWLEGGHVGAGREAVVQGLVELVLPRLREPAGQG